MGSTTRPGGMGIDRFQLYAMFAVAGASALPAVGGTIQKASSGPSLSDGSAWVGNAAPTGSDVAVFDAALTSLKTFTLGGSPSWGAIQVTNPSGALVINDSADNFLILYGVMIGGINTGIDLSAATQNLTLNASVALKASQTWAVGPSRVLSVSGGITGTANLTKDGPGVLALSGSNAYFGVTQVNNGELRLDLAPGLTNIFPAMGTLSLAGGNLHMTGTGLQTIYNLNSHAGSSRILVDGGTLTLTGMSRQGAATTLDSSALQIATTGTVLWKASQPIIADTSENPYATYGLNDWAASDAAGRVSAATYSDVNSSSAITTGTNVNITGDLTVGSSVDVRSVRFADAATPFTVTVAGANIWTVRGILVAGTSAGGTIAGATALLRPNRANGSTAGCALTIIQNSTHGDLTLSAPIGNASSNTPVSLIKAGPGRVILASTANAFTGQIYIDDGILSVADNHALGLPPTGGTLTLQGGTLQTTASIGLYNSTLGTANRAIIIGQLGGGFDVAAGALTIPGTLSGSGPLTKTGPGTLILNGPNTYSGGTTITGGALVLGNASALGSGPVAITSSLIISPAAPSGTLLLANRITGPGAIAINAGAIVLSSSASGTGPLTVASGASLEFGANLVHTAGTLAGGGTIQVDAGAQLTAGLLSSLGTLVSAGRTTLRPSAALTGRTASVTDLILAGSPGNWTGKLDLTNNNLIVTHGASVPGQIKQAAHLGTWNSTAGGITSSTALAAATGSTATALAYATGTEYTAATGKTTFDGLAFRPTDTLIEYTLSGDANMDNSVTFADFLALQNNYNRGGDWAQGDWNYDGQVTFADFLILQNNYNKTLKSSNLLGNGPIPSAPAAPDESPEPGSLLFLTGGVASLFRRTIRLRRTNK